MATIRGTTHSAGAKRGGLMATIKANETYIHNLKQYLYGIPKKAAGVVAATLLHKAMDAENRKTTVHDSSRAAANWNLVFGASPPPAEWDPKTYNQHPAGGRGDSGLNASAVSEYKQGYYGYKWDGKFAIPNEGGKIHSALRVGQSGALPQIHLYNPIFTPQSDYTKHAWGEKNADGSLLAGVVLSQVSNDYMPKYIHEIAKKLRSSAFFKEF